MSSSSTTGPSHNLTIISQLPPPHSSGHPDNNINISRNINNNNNNSRRFLFVRRLSLIILLLFALTSLVNFMAWRIIHPLPPLLQLTSFNISSNGDNYDIRFAVKNPNKKLSLAMENVEVVLLHGKTMVSRRERMPPIYLKKKMINNIVSNGSRPMEEATAHLHGKMVVKLEVIMSINHEYHQWGKAGEATMMIKIDGKVNCGVKYLAWGWLSKRADLEFFCRDLSLRFPSAQWKLGDLILIGGTRECSSHFL